MNNHEGLLENNISLKFDITFFMSDGQTYSDFIVNIFIKVCGYTQLKSKNNDQKSYFKIIVFISFDKKVFGIVSFLICPSDIKMTNKSLNKKLGYKLLVKIVLGGINK